MEEDGGATSTIMSSNRGIISAKQQSVVLRIENPFTFKVGQVFTGFGFGCGLGIGVGRPLNLGAIPMLNQVMSAASGATHAFSGVARHVNTSLKKIGAKNIEAGIGCGVGFGHGFGIGVALKPGVVPRIQTQIMEAMTKLMTKFGENTNLPLGNIPDMMRGNIEGDKSMNAGISNSASNSVSLDLSMGTRSEKLINNFLKDPVLKGEDANLPRKDEKLQLENEVLGMVLKHQRVIEELIKENEMLRQILVDDLKVPSNKFRTTSHVKLGPPCSDCFECRRKERRK